MNDRTTPWRPRSEFSTPDARSASWGRTAAGGEDEDAAVARAAREYLDALERGESIARHEFLADHPEIATALADCLDVLEMMQRVTPTARSKQAPSEQDAEMPAPQPLGDFRIVRELGRGGMGVVYEAVQLSLDRRVALKVLPFVAALDPVRLQRFKQEAHAAAQLHHTHIVPVYAVGAERGVHFYAMQLIVGHSLAALVEGLRDARGAESSASGLPRATADATAPARSTVLSPAGGSANEYFRTVARLFAQVALALEHAHRFGVIHRDIKPGNLILDETGHIWITDFGLAQFQSDMNLTRTGDMLGTLRYMSPEQIAGGRTLLDHRTDIHALGATLYELLTLEPLVGGDDRAVLMRQVLEDEPRPPRTIDPRVPVELETIVLKAVARAPSDRYDTAEQMADDLQRWLDDRPILARRPTWRERAARWRRRHRALVRTGVVVLLLATIGSLATSLMLGRAYRREMAQRGAAEASFRQARQAVDQFMQLSEEELAARPSLHQLRRKFLQASLEYYESFLAQRGSDASMQQDLAATRQRVAQIVDDLALMESYRPILLLSDENVADELALTAAQRRDTERILTTLLAEGPSAAREPSPGSGSPEQQFAASLRAHQDEMSAVLTPAQWQRLQQIALQAQGPMAFKTPEIEEALALTAAQRASVQRIIEENAPHPGKHHDHGPPGDRPGPPPRRDDDETGRRPGPPGRGHGPPPHAEMRARMDRTVAQILAELSEEQRQRWSALVGERIAYDLRMSPDEWMPR